MSVSLTEAERRTAPMTEKPEPATKTVRVDKEAANKLQTIAALKDEMGEQFRVVEFLNGLIVEPVEELHAATLKAYQDFKSRHPKGGRKKP